jgi:DNA-binding SARP family transcriptional activator
MPHLTLHLFGPPRVQRDGEPVRIVRHRAIACAVYLAVTGQEVSREALAALFWPEAEPVLARADLRRTLHLLHQALGPEQLITVQERVRFRRDEGLWLDVEHFRGLLAACQGHGHGQDEVCPDCLPLLAAAAVLYRDDFLAGFTLPDSPDFDRWQWLEGEKLRGELASALVRLVRGHSALGEFSHAIAYARRWVALDPLDEQAQRGLMQLYAWNGERSAALSQYQMAARLLDQELNVEPDLATRRLEQSIRAGRLAPPPSAEQMAMTQGRAGRPAAAEPVNAGEDELRMVTVLSAGLQWSEHVNDDLDVLVAQTEQLLAMARAACVPYAGRVERAAGGNVLALFGLDRIHEDDAERAVRAALAIQEASRGQSLPVQIGVNTGLAFCIRPGPGAPADAQLMGMTVNLAAQLRDHAGSGGILVGGAAHRPTRGVFDYAALELALPGFSQRVTAYRVLRLSSQPVKARGVEGLVAPLIGRDAEMEVLRSVRSQVYAGRGQVVLISGAAGVGKSRLVGELRKECRPRPGEPQSPLLWLEGRCLELATATSYWPVVDMLRDYLARDYLAGDYLAGANAAADADDGALADRLSATLQALAGRGDLTAEQVEEIGPVLARLLSLRCGTAWDERGQRIDARQVRRRTCDAVLMFVSALARESPVVLVFEDLHWADTPSLDLIGALMQGLASAALLLVGVYRPEQAQAGDPLLALSQQYCPDRCTALHLHELDPEQSRQLLALLLAIEQLPEQTRALILGKAQGNPFFLEEIVRGQIDSGLLFRRGDSWRARAEIAALVPPETVQSVILGRVDRLPAEQKRLLQAAAVMGRFFQRRLLTALVPAGFDLDAALAVLAAAALIYQERAIPEVEYSFRHVLVQDAIYQAMPARRRAPLHRQVAEAIEGLNAGRLRAHVEQLAYHYDLGGPPEKAVEYLVRAGEKAQDSYSNDEAISYYRRGLARLDAFAAAAWSEADQWRLAALKGLGIVAWNTSNLVESEVHFRCAIDLAQTMTVRPRELASLYGWLCRALRWQNRLEAAILAGKEGLARLNDDTNSIEAAILYGNLVDAYLLMDRRVEYDAIVERLAQLLVAQPYSDDLLFCYGYAMLAHRDRNEMKEAFRWMRFAQQGLQDGHNPLFAAALHMWQIPRCREAIGDMRAAIAENELGIELCRKVGDTRTLAWGLNHLAERHMAVGELAEAEVADQESLAFLCRMGLEGEIMEGTHILAALRYCQGAAVEAMELIGRAMELASRTGFIAALGFHRTLLGRILLAQGCRAEAQTQFRLVLEATTPHARNMPWMINSLSGLEVTSGGDTEFRTYCTDIESRRPELARLGLRQWWLEPDAPDPTLPVEAFERLAQQIGQGTWQWLDPFGDCTYILDEGLVSHEDFVICAANCRDLWANNHSAPRLVRPIAGDCAVQVTCSQALADRPAIGGILLWHDKANYLCLIWGGLGADQVMLAGALDNRNVVIGRGTLPNAGRVSLRLERVGDEVRALCSADGQQWYRVGQPKFEGAGPLLMGLHAIGSIDRTIYRGAYQEGTAIRFAR